MLSKFGDLFFYMLFFIGGCVLLFAGVDGIVRQSSLKKHGVETVAIIENIKYKGPDEKKSADIYVAYLVNGCEYYNKTSDSEPSMRIGHKIDIYYDRDNPNEVSVKSGNMAYIACIGVSSAILIPVTILWIDVIKRRRKNKRLMETGRLIEAYIESIERDRSDTMKGRRSYIITCTYIDPMNNIRYYFDSQRVWDDVCTKIKSNNIAKLNVYVDMNNMDEYYVDVNKKRMGKGYIA